MRKSWGIIKQVINKNKNKSLKTPKISINGRLCEDTQTIADSFNNFFSYIGTTLDQKIPQTQIDFISYIPKSKSHPQSSYRTRDWQSYRFIKELHRRLG